MSEIRIDPGNMDVQKGSLNMLFQAFSSSGSVFPDISGEGRAASDVYDIGAALTELRKSLELLLEETVFFLNSAKDSFINTDEQISKGYKN